MRRPRREARQGVGRPDGWAGSWRAGLWAGCLGVVCVALPAAAQVEGGGAAVSLRAHVGYLSSSSVYLDAGRDDGVTVGARGEVLRNGEQVAVIEVDFVAAHSASCRVVTQRQTIRQGDEVVLTLAPDAVAGGAAAVSAPPPSAPSIETPPAASPSRLGAPAPFGGRRGGSPALVSRLTGSFSLGLQDYADRVLAGRGYQEGTGRLVLRGRNLGGAPVGLRVRMSARQTERRRASGSERDPRIDRLYELSLSYAPEEGRFSAAVGRLGAGPFVSVGYLDGVLAQVRVSRHLHLGALAGSRPEVAELGLASIGRKYGAFVRYASRPDEAPRFAELIVAGVGEYASGGEVSREYLALESRFGSGARWSVFQRAEIDFHRSWRQDLAGSSSQVSNASLSASLRLNQRWRALVSYDQRRDYLTWETRPRPEDVFTNFLREGGRATLEWQGAGGWNVSGSLGVESQPDRRESTTSAGLTMFKNGLFGRRYQLGADASTYAGDLAEGWVASLRLRRYWSGGHDLGLTLGASEARLEQGEPRTNEWVRLSATAQLPGDLYVIGELEYDTGTDLEGQRYIVEIGYRF